METHRSGNFSKRDIVNTTVSALAAFVSAPNAFSCITIRSRRAEFDSDRDPSSPRRKSRRHPADVASRPAA